MVATSCSQWEEKANSEMQVQGGARGVSGAPDFFPCEEIALRVMNKAEMKNENITVPSATPTIEFAQGSSLMLKTSHTMLPYSELHIFPLVSGICRRSQSSVLSSGTPTPGPLTPQYPPSLKRWLRHC